MMMMYNKRKPHLTPSYNDHPDRRLTNIFPALTWKALGAISTSRLTYIILFGAKSVKTMPKQIGKRDVGNFELPCSAKQPRLLKPEISEYIFREAQRRSFITSVIAETIKVRSGVMAARTVLCVCRWGVWRFQSSP